MDASTETVLTPESLLERIAHLEMRLAIQEDIVTACLEQGVARTIQSLGAVVEYLAKQGLIREEELQAYIKDKYRVVGLPVADGSLRPVLDIHEWLSWRKSGRKRFREIRTAPGFFEELIDPSCATNAMGTDGPLGPPEAA